MPTVAECSGKIKLIKVEEISAHRVKRAEKVEFQVVETDCSFLEKDKSYSSPNIHHVYVDEPSMEVNKVYSGEFARSSTMGPKGVVPWTKFISPAFPGWLDKLQNGPLPVKGFSFSFSHK